MELNEYEDSHKDQGIPLLLAIQNEEAGINLSPEEPVSYDDPDRDPILFLKKMERSREKNRNLRIALCYSVIFENYTNALRCAGLDLGLNVEPVWFDCGTATEGMRPFAEFCAQDFDGLLLPGGRDIDPSFYGEENQGSIAPDLQTDRCQFAMAEAFVKARKPILGICRGHQLLNVYFGGSLYQDILEKGDHMRLAGEKDNRNIIKAEKGFILCNLYGENFAVNSSHHQAVKQPGKGMRVTARCQDGVIEAMEHESLPIFTVQFHPERMDYGNRREDTVAGGKIFEEFLEITRKTIIDKNPD